MTDAYKYLLRASLCMAELKSRWKEGLRECSTEELEYMVKTIQGIIDERNES